MNITAPISNKPNGIPSPRPSPKASEFAFWEVGYGVDVADGLPEVLVLIEAILAGLSVFVLIDEVLVRLSGCVLVEEVVDAAAEGESWSDLVTIVPTETEKVLAGESQQEEFGPQQYTRPPSHGYKGILS
jgi:hypothetical protein